MVRLIGHNLLAGLVITNAKLNMLFPKQDGNFWMKCRRELEGPGWKTRAVDSSKKPMCVPAPASKQEAEAQARSAGEFDQFKKSIFHFFFGSPAASIHSCARNSLISSANCSMNSSTELSSDNVSP